MKLTIKAEVMAGENIRDAFEAAITLSKKLDCFVDFDFNGVHCTASASGSPEIGEENYHLALRTKTNFAPA